MTKSDELDDTMRVLSTGTCDTLSGSSRLTYHIGSCRTARSTCVCTATPAAASSSGVDLAAGHPDGTEEASGREAHHVHPVNASFRGRSANTPGFMLAVLLHEKVVRSMQGKLRRHQLADPSVFTDKVQKLMAAAGANVKGKAAQKPARSTTRKKPAAASPRKKSKADSAT